MDDDTDGEFDEDDSNQDTMDVDATLAPPMTDKSTINPPLAWCIITRGVS